MSHKNDVGANVHTLLLIGFRSLNLPSVRCHVFPRESCSLAALYAAKPSSTSLLHPGLPEFVGEWNIGNCRLRTKLRGGKKSLAGSYAFTLATPRRWCSEEVFWKSFSSKPLFLFDVMTERRLSILDWYRKSTYNERRGANDTKAILCPMVNVYSTSHL